MSSLGPNHRQIDKFLLLIIPAGLFVYLSTRPLMRLQADPPAQFLRTNRQSGARSSEERLARGYWDCAITFVQWKYTYGTPLPEDPPDAFRIDAKTYGADANSQPSRLRYWSKLRETWLAPASWRQDREWSTSWLTEPVTKIVNWLDDWFKDLFRA